MRGCVPAVGMAVLLAVTGTSHAHEVSVTARVRHADTRCTISGFAAYDGAQKIGIITLFHLLAVDSSSLITIGTPAETSKLLALTENCWTEPVPVADSVTVDLWPRGSVIGELASERQIEPRAVHGVFVDAEADRNAGKSTEEHSVECTLQGRAWRCSVPANRPLHLRLAVDDFAPLYVWDLVVRETSDVGVQQLVRGGSIVGRVVDDTGQPIRNAQVSLAPVTAAHQPAADRQLTRSRARSDAKGYFQLIGVPAGEYRIASSAEGRADAEHERIEVRAGEDLRITQPLVHAMLAELEVVITPPVSASQRPWKVLLRRPGSRMSEVIRVAEGDAGPNGVWRKENLQPGSYQMTILTADDSEVARQSVELRGGPERILVTVSAIEVHGKVVPSEIAGEVALEFVREGRRVKSTTDAEGAFTAAFPTPGTWHPSIYLGPTGADMRLAPVEIESSHDDELVLEVPAGRIRGRVLAPDGRPARGVVRVRRDGRMAAQGQTDDDGRFDLFGLVPGSFDIEGETSDAFAGPIPIEVTGERAVEIDLRTASSREVTGSVVTADGAAASGAVVRVFDPATRAYDDIIADGRGSYSFRVNPSAAMVDLIFIAPPHPIALRRFPIRADKRTVSIGAVQLASAGSKLRVLIQRTPPWPSLRTADGRTYALVLLLAPRFGYGPFRELVNGVFEFWIEPGSYTLCNDAGECHAANLAPHAEALVKFAFKNDEGAQ
jgi:hypothetical protein